MLVLVLGTYIRPVTVLDSLEAKTLAVIDLEIKEPKLNILEGTFELSPCPLSFWFSWLPKRHFLFKRPVSPTKQV